MLNAMLIRGEDDAVGGTLVGGNIRGQMKEWQEGSTAETTEPNRAAREKGGENRGLFAVRSAAEVGVVAQLVCSKETSISVCESASIGKRCQYQVVPHQT